VIAAAFSRLSLSVNSFADMGTPQKKTAMVVSVLLSAEIAKTLYAQ
jgi:hypothetical protein